MPEEQGGFTRFTHEEQGEFAEGGDAYLALGISPNMQIVLDKNGFMVDIWDSQTKKLYNSLGYEIGTRDASYELPADPKDVKDFESEDDLEDAASSVAKDISEESRVIARMRGSFAYKFRRYRDLQREIGFRQRKEDKQGYQRRYYIPNKYPVYTGVYRSSVVQTSGFFKS